MKVKDLIEALQNFPPDALVVVDGYEGGVSTAGQPAGVRVVLNVNTDWYYGPHEIVLLGDYEFDKGADAVYLRRTKGKRQE
jgi:hypothetical protein